MSRLYFHSPSGDAALYGSELAWTSGLVRAISNGALNLTNPANVERLRGLIHPAHYMAHHPIAGPGMPWRTAYEMAFHSDYGEHRPDRPLLQFDSEPISTLSLTLNTALRLGNDAVRLAARLDGQCNIHAWVDGPNRAWLADIIQGGLDAGVLRTRSGYHEGPDLHWLDPGWAGVIELLRARDDEPVVTSYSVADQFPNPGEDAVADDTWDDLDAAEHWRLGMRWLRASPKKLEMKPDDWASYTFNHGLSVLDLFAPDSDERLQRALGNPLGA